MSPQLRARKRGSSSSHPSRDDYEESPPKRMLTSLSEEKMKWQELPEKVFHVIFSHCHLHQLCAMSQVSHKINKYTVSFLDSPSSIPVLFPSLKVVTEEDNTVPMFFIKGSEEKFGINMTVARINFKLLGTLVKKMTCLLPTRERIMMSTKLMSRLSPCSALSPSSHMMSLCGIFLHQIVRGWTDEEVTFAAQLIFLTFNGGEEACVSSILTSEYILGSRPDMEMHVRNFLSSVFYKEAAFGQEHLWFETLLHQSSSLVNISNMSRLLLLMSSPAKNEVWQFGVQWADHVEAIPATLAVASSRYHFLICLLNTLRNGQYGSMLPSILSSIFHTPSPWLPENIGSVLLLLGHHSCSIYLEHLLDKVINRTDLCTNCFKDISTAITGLALMTARFRWSFAPMLARMEEVIMRVPEKHRGDILRAIWKSLAEEVTDIRQSEGEDWATESSMYLFRVIRLIGQRMTERAFLDLATPDAQERSLSIEE